MSRYLILVTFLFCLFINNLFINHHNDLAMQQDSIIEYQASIDFSSVENSDSDKFVFGTILAGISIVTLYIYQSIPFTARIQMRRKQLLPVFYQSNYVIHSLLNQNN
ncbi:hypothetical protein [Ornithinibacillus xuwenensis]|uniref:Uncharacterized protein n=1 Tax=Ornithinibacillus xuwenensis TaxID=3144668 RepID=A0ABU9XDG6_9BACI